MRRLQRSRIEAYLALAGIAAAALPMTWYLRSALILLLAGIIADLIVRSPLTIKWPLWVKGFCIVAALALLIATAWRPIFDDYRGVELPEVGLRFVSPQAPMIVLDNKSGAIAKEIKWIAAIWNADNLRGYIQGSDGYDPLPIPVQTFDVLRPHTSSGGQGVFLQSKNAGYIRPGNRLIGSAGVICPNCSRGYTYFVYIVWGQGGWYAEDRSTVEGEVRVPTRITRDNLEAYFAMISQIPETERHQIEQPY
jgi:hypothetical protein